MRSNVNSNSKMQSSPVEGNILSTLNKVAQIVKNLVRALWTFLSGIILFFTSPLGLITLLALTGYLLFSSSIQTWGPLTFKEYIESESRLELSNISSEEKQETAIASHLISNGVSPEASVYFSKQAKNGNYTAISGAVDCNTECLINRLKDGSLDKNKVSLGAFNITGDNLLPFLEEARRNGKEWTDKSAQVNYINKQIISEALQEGAGLRSSNTIVEGVNEINRIIGKDIIAGKEAVDLVHSLKQISKKLSNKKHSVKKRGRIYGSGKGRGRLEGGGAKDMGGLLDASELVRFMESFTTSNKIYTYGGSGIEQATPEMLSAKALAESKGGPDPAPYLYASCDRFVAIALKATEIDVNFPWGAVQDQHNYVVSQPSRWQQVSPEDRQSGDVIFYRNNGGTFHHVNIFGVTDDGVLKIYEASYFDSLPSKVIISENLYNPDPYNYNEIEYWRFVGG